MIKVLVVDDHPLFRSGAVATIGAELDMEVVGEEEEAERALDVTSWLEPNVILTDIRLKGNTSGVELARHVREGQPDVKILVLTNYSNEPYIRAMMEIGVEGFVLKDTPPSEVVNAIRMVMDGRTVFSEPVTRVLVRSFLTQPTASHAGLADGDSLREAQVLQVIAEGASNTEIATHLNVTVGTVEYHLTNLYAKLGVRSRSEAIVQAARRGLVVIDA